MIHRLFNSYILYPLAERLQGRRIRTKLKQLRSTSALPLDQRLQRQRQLLARIVQVAGNDVPYYRDLFRRIGFDPSKLDRDFAYLKDLPYLTKDIIREHGRRLLNPEFPEESLHRRMTSGSTGSSLAVYYSQDALDFTAAVNLFALELAGKKRHFSEVHLASRFPERFPLRDRLKERIKCAALNRTVIFIDSLNEADLELIWHKLRRTGPYLLQGHPSTMHALALHIKRRGHSTDRVLRVFESTGEVLTDNNRQTIETTFNCRVVNRYGNAEFGVVAYETLNDPQHRLKVLDQVTHPETATTADGSQELALTGLFNTAMPLIRYRTSDLADIIRDERGIYLTNLQGRVHDLLKLGTKTYPTHYIQDVLERVGSIEQFQIEHRTDRQPLLRLVLSQPQNAPQVTQKIHAFWPEVFEIKYVTYSDLKRSGRQGKFRYLVKSPD